MLRIVLIFCTVVIPIWAEQGFNIRNDGEIPITKYAMFSERASGSNYVEALLMFNTELQSASFCHKHFPPWFELPSEKYHGDPRHRSFENTDHILFVIVVRNAYDWLRSLYRQPHQIDQSFARLPFKLFVSSPWRINFSDAIVLDELKKHPLIDTNPEDEQPFANAMHLRTAKAKNMLLIKQKAKNVYYIRYETVRDHPKEVIEELSKAYNLKLKEYQPIVHYKGHTALPIYSKKTYPPFSKEDLAFINSQLDEALEHQLGYHLIDDPDMIE